MSGLGPDSRAFLREALESDAPRAEDRQRLRALLAARPDGPSLPEPSSTGAAANGAATAKVSSGASASAGGAGAAAGGLAGGVKGLVAVAMFGLATGAGVLLYREAPRLRAVTPAAVAPSPPESEPLPATSRGLDEGALDETASNAAPNAEPVAEPETEAADTTPSAPPELRRPSRTRRELATRDEGPGALAEEARLLALARAALREGEAARALALVEVHAARFPRGELLAERWAARGFALCALGRREDARGSRDRLAALSPGSAVLGRLDETCGFGPESGE